MVLFVRAIGSFGRVACLPVLNGGVFESILQSHRYFVTVSVTGCAQH